MIKWFALHPTAANVLMILIIFLGMTALPNIQRATFPEVQNTDVEITVIYKGATPDEVEDAICRRIEDVLESITDLDEIRCESLEGKATATAVMLEGADMARFLNDINTEIDTIDNFPEQAEKPIIRELARTDAVVSVAITGLDDPVLLKTYAENVKDRLMRYDTIAEVSISGFSQHQIRIEIPAWKLRQFGVSATDIANTIKAQSINRPAGQLKGKDEDILLRFDDQRQTIAQFQRLVVVSNKNGAIIRLGDIATITDRFERDEDKIYFNGQRAAVLNVAKNTSQDILTTFNTVKNFVEQENQNSVSGIKLSLTQDHASVVKERLALLVDNGIQGLIMVFLVLWLFFSFRYSFWVTLGLPVAFLGGLFIMPMLGVTINLLSMVGLLIGIGLLMDDAIVISENIAKRMAQGDPPMPAAYNGAKQVFSGIMASFVTTILMFGSLIFITGDIGQILKVMPIVLIIVLTVSLVEAFLILPNHLGHSLAYMQHSSDSKFRQKFEQGFDKLQNRYFGHILDTAIEYRYLTLGLVLMLVILALAMLAGGKLKVVGFPSTDGDIVEARVLLPQGTPLAKTEQIVAKITQGLQQTNAHFKPLQSDEQDFVKNTTVIYGQNPDAYETGPHVVRIIADLLGADQRNASVDEFRQIWRQNVGQLTDIIAVKYAEPVLGPAGRAIDIRLLGSELATLKSASLELQQWLNAYQGVIDINDDLRPGKRQYQIHLKDIANSLGLNAEDVSAQIQTAYQGKIIDEFPLGAETYEVDLRLVSADRASIEDLEQHTIISPNGDLIPISVVAEMTEVRNWARIHRIDGLRAVTIQGDVQHEFVNAKELIALAEQKIFPVLQEKYPGMVIQVEGEVKEAGGTGRSIFRHLFFGLIGIYIMLTLQFRGYLAPMTVMSVIPTALIGVVFGHLWLNLDLTMPSIIGMAALFGVVVNDSILLVEFIREQRSKGVAVLIAAKQAGRLRFRPILLTSVTTIAGLLPLLTEQSLQAQILIPLATSLAFGLTSATLTALFLVPAIYCILDDFNALGALSGHSE